MLALKYLMKILLLMIRDVLLRELDVHFWPFPSHSNEVPHASNQIRLIDLTTYSFFDLTQNRQSILHDLIYELILSRFQIQLNNAPIYLILFHSYFALSLQSYESFFLGTTGKHSLMSFVNRSSVIVLQCNKRLQLWQFRF